jgi:hypothetical protein
VYAYVYVSIHIHIHLCIYRRVYTFTYTFVYIYAGEVLRAFQLTIDNVIFILYLYTFAYNVYAMYKYEYI